MSSFLCFICHSTVNSDTKEETREKYREVVGMTMCPNSHMCHICCHVLNKLSLFRSVCMKRSLEYPVLFSEKGTLNLQRNDIELQTICQEDTCGHYRHSNINSKTYHFVHVQQILDSEYGIFKDERIDFDDYFNTNNEDQTIHELENTVKALEEVGDVKNEFDLTDDRNDNNQIDDCNNDECFNEIHDNSDVVDSVSDPEIDTVANIKEVGELKANTDQEVTVKKKRKKKSKKNDFEKIVLSLEQQKMDLESRRKEKKYLEAEFKCYNCARGFFFKDSYQTHMMRHEESNGEHVCPICSLRFALASVLRAHCASHSERYKCRCGSVVAGRARSTHARKCSRASDEAECHKCATMFLDSSGLQQHLKRYHRTGQGNRTYSCSVCGKSYNNQAAVRTHMIKHINRKFNCDKCESTFSSPYTLNQHRKKHESTDVTQYYCSSCNTAYNCRKSLLAHYRNSMKHQQTIYECPVCSRVCPNQRSLKLHIEAVHSTSKDFACPSCPIRYSNRKSLLRHMRTHSVKPQVKIAICQICGASFKGNNKLNRHLREVCKKAQLEEEFANLYDQELLIPE